MLDIKNNRQRSQGTGGPLTISAVLSAGVLKWLRTSGIDEVQLRNLSWQQVLQPNKKVSCPMSKGPPERRAECQLHPFGLWCRKVHVKETVLLHTSV